MQKISYFSSLIRFSFALTKYCIKAKNFSSFKIWGTLKCRFTFYYIQSAFKLNVKRQVLNEIVFIIHFIFLKHLNLKVSDIIL